MKPAIPAFKLSQAESLLEKHDAFNTGLSLAETLLAIWPSNYHWLPKSLCEKAFKLCREAASSRLVWHLDCPPPPPPPCFFPCRLIVGTVPVCCWIQFSPKTFLYHAPSQSPQEERYVVPAATSPLPRTWETEHAVTAVLQFKVSG